MSPQSCFQTTKESLENLDFGVAQKILTLPSFSTPPLLAQTAFGLRGGPSPAESAPPGSLRPPGRLGPLRRPQRSGRDGVSQPGSSANRLPRVVASGAPHLRLALVRSGFGPGAYRTLTLKQDGGRERASLDPLPPSACLRLRSRCPFWSELD